MIKQVIVCGIRRGGELVPRNEILQMFGRCGRSYTEDGEAVLIVSENDETMGYDYIEGGSSSIKSVMDIEETCFHVLPQIKEKRVKDEDSFKRWYEKTLRFQQGKKINYDDVINKLKEYDCLYSKEEGGYCISPMGKISSDLYIRPDKLKIIYDRIKEIKDFGSFEESVDISWILSEEQKVYIESSVDEIDEYRSACRGRHLSIEKEELVSGYINYCVLNGLKPKWLRHQINTVKGDVGRKLLAIKLICEYEGISEYTSTYDNWLTCLKYRVPYLVSKLMNEFKTNKVDIYQLNDYGIRSIDDFIDKQEKIRKYLPEIYERIMKNGMSDRIKEI